MASPQTDNTGQIVQRKKNDEPQLITLLKRMGPAIASAAPRHINPDRLLRITLTEIRRTPALLNCSEASFLGSIMTAAQLGLEPGGALGLCYLIPYKKSCQLIIGYQGYMELARRSGLVSSIYAYDVREGDTFKYRLGLNPDIVHEPLDDPRREAAKVTHVYAVARIKDAEPVFVVLTRAQIEARKRRSAASGSGPWVTDEVAMMLKTGIRALWKWLPKTTEIATATAIDDAAETGRSQASAWDQTVVEAMQKEGIDTEGEDTTGNGEQPAPEVPVS